MVSFTINDIQLFSSNEGKSNNNKNNKIREDIIVHIINDKIPIDWYLNENWIFLKDQVFKFLCSITEFKSVSVEKKAGRQYHCDFLVTFTLNDDTVITKGIEWKYGVTCVEQCPQWVSPMKPSQYLSNSYEEYFYDNHLKDIVGDNEFPQKDTYLKEIHNDKPPCMLSYQDRYYMGAKQSSRYSGNLDDEVYHKKCKETTKQSIKDFIQKTDLRVDILNQYLYRTQHDKIYMCCKNNHLYKDIPNKDDYTINPLTILKTINQYVGLTISGRKIKILLRWKNGNGIAFPAFQIS